MTQKPDVIADIVHRSRAGDQIATAHISLASELAKKGNRKAKAVVEKVLAYCKAHPLILRSHMSFFGAESPPALEAQGPAYTLRKNLASGAFSGKGLSFLVLALGKFAVPILQRETDLLAKNSEVLVAARDALADDECRAAFDRGLRECKAPKALEAAITQMPPPCQKACQLGAVLGRARALQGVTRGAPLRVLCVDTAWELGE